MTYDTPYTEGYFERGEGSNYTNYGDDPGWAPTVRVICEYERPETLTELGCAKGYFVQHCLEVGIDAEGMDISEYAVNAGPDDTRPCLWLLDATTDPLPWADGRVDMVCSWEFLEHLGGDGLRFALAEADRVLRPGGLAVHRIGIAGVTPPGHIDADTTHADGTGEGREWWEALFAGMGYTHEPELERLLRDEFADRDWTLRFFAWRKPA
jgi:SAM-dependent methyltransferase